MLLSLPLELHALFVVSICGPLAGRGAGGADNEMRRCNVDMGRIKGGHDIRRQPAIIQCQKFR